MVTTGTEVIDRVLKGFRQYDQPDVLTATMTNSQTALVFQGILNGWSVSTVVEAGDELMLVTDVNSLTNTATVIRGWLGTTATTHAANIPLYLNPVMMRSDILNLINESIEDMMGHDLYQVDTLDKDYASGTIGLDLDATVRSILRVDAKINSQAINWKSVYDWEHIDNALTSDFPSGQALMLRASLPTGAKIRVIYAKDFSQLTAETEDLEADAGLTPYMADLPYYFAMSRLMTDAERRRSQLEGAANHQRAQDSPPFLSLRTGEWYQARYLDKVVRSRMRLRKEVKIPRGTGYGS